MMVVIFAAAATLGIAGAVALVIWLGRRQGWRWVGVVGEAFTEVVEALAYWHS